MAGAVAAGAVATWAYCRQNGIELGPLALAAAPALPVAQAIAVWGNWFSQGLYGRPSGLPWAVEISPAHRAAGYQAVATFQPIFLYESLLYLLVAAARRLLDPPVPADRRNGVRPVRGAVRDGQVLRRGAPGRLHPAPVRVAHQRGRDARHPDRRVVLSAGGAQPAQAGAGRAGPPPAPGTAAAGAAAAAAASPLRHRGRGQTGPAAGGWRGVAGRGQRGAGRLGRSAGGRPGTRLGR